jgi:hypothetical protein
MGREFVVGILAVGLSSCAIVPDLPNDEQTFSYAEIVNQIECETKYAVDRLQSKTDENLKTKDKRVYAWADLDNWSIDISISPGKTIDMQAGINATSKTIFGQSTTKASDYFQTVLGGTSASPGGILYEGYGNILGKNEYQMKIGALYDKVVDKKGDYLDVTARRFHDHMDCLPEGILQTAVPENDFTNGFFGVHDFLEQSLAATLNLTLQPKTVGYAKEYRKRIQVGVTPGWYTALGNVGPVVGGYGLLDNIIGITFAPPTPPSPVKPIPVYVVAGSLVTAPVKGAGPHPRHNLFAPAAAARFRLTPEESNTLTNGANSILAPLQTRQQPNF